MTIQTSIPRAAAATLALLAAAPAAPAGPITVVSLPFGNVGGDHLDRGFYVQNYGADNIDTVELNYLGLTTGDYQIRLTVRQGAYDGPVVGTQTVTRHFDADVFDSIVFNLGAQPAILGGTLTFQQELLISADVDGDFFYDVGPGGLADFQGVIETEATTPPLDTFRRDGVGVIITAIPTPASALVGAGALPFFTRRRRA